MAGSRFLDALAKGVVVFDGAMGTRLYEKGIFINKSFDELNLSQPGIVQEVHGEYVRSGVDVIETNTFGANRLKLTPHGFGEKVKEINEAGAKIAREVAGGAFVAGAVGPLGVKIEPWGPTSIDEARDLFKEQIAALVSGGVDILCFETFADVNELGQAIRAAKEVAPELPIIAQMTIDDDGNSLYGTPPEVFTRRLEEWGADVIGVNCSVGPAAMLHALERMGKVTKKPLSAQPNAGQPRLLDGRTIYECSPEYMASYARRFIQTGARLVGGCCGTTPRHVKAIVGAARMLSPRERPEAERLVHAEPTTHDTSRLRPAVEPIPYAERSRLAAKIAKGEKIVSIELNPPKGTDLKGTLKRAKQAKDGGSDAVNIPDGPRATARMSALATAVLIQQEVGIETILHYCCRDRNLLGMQADLLGAFALGIRNLILITGDPPKLGDYPDATAVFDVDSIGLTNMVSRLNKAFDLGGSSFGKPTGFNIGVGANPGALDENREIERFFWKCDAGAEFAVTQPVYDVGALNRFLDAVRARGLQIPVVAGIWPLVSLRNAEFMKHEVPGVVVPDSVVERMAKAQEKGSDAAVAEGVQIAREAVHEIKDRIAGLQVSAPLGRVEVALQVVDALRD
ncbi:MAG TPA: bifunctional homocysteine S-methyltransferase/methylenetetrahydrofolate reductase [Planctomycetota bacterium]|nr:bifunctional homocysteine S-methyltransferase/methylenetetrahydrofolate reductase [Planctomycetota bacterium]